MIRQTFDMNAVNTILFSTEIWPYIAPEGVEPFDVPFHPECTYFMVNDGDGVIIFHPFRDGMKIHPNFRLNYRGKLAYKAIDEAVREMFSRGHSSIYAEIALELTHVRHAAKHLGFNRMEIGERVLFVRRRLDS